MIHPHTELRFINDVIGYGVVATALIPRGTIVWALDDLDQVLTQEKIESLSPFMKSYVHKYAYIDGKGDHILCWDHARFFNHHCEANCLSSGYEFEIAVRDILPGEQLTDDYGGLNIEEPFSCACGSPACRGVIHPDDILTLAESWDRKIAECFPLLDKVAQPLWPVVRRQVQVQDVIEGRLPIASARDHYFAGAR